MDADNSLVSLLSLSKMWEAISRHAGFRDYSDAQALIIGTRPEKCGFIPLLLPHVPPSTNHRPPETLPTEV